MALKLWVFHGGAAPRRVVIYLAERGFTSDDVEIIPATIAAPGAPAEAPGKPQGAVPLLALGDGKYVHESLAIIEYLEDLTDSRGLPTMRGRTPEERARVREMLGLAEQMTLAIELAAVHGSIIFASEIENQQSAASVRYLLRHCHKNLSRIEEYASPGGPFLVSFDDQHAGPQVTIVDCVVFATLQYAVELFGVDLTEHHRRLRQFYDAFKMRPSAVIPEGTWHPQLTSMTKKWIEY